jgi:pimeloyl-ACP methyl ester carboxylesterase
VLDNRGTGKSTAPPGPFRIRDLADDAARVLTDAGAGQADVFGISMGGMIAQELALRHPDRVRRLVLGATFASHRRSHKPRLSVAGDLALALLLTHRPRRVARLLVSDEHFARFPNGLAGWVARARVAPVRTVSRQIAAITRHETESRLPALRAPTLVLSGDRDRMVPVENSRRLAGLIPGARLVEFPGAGHAFPFEREAETLKLVTQHLLG